MADQSLPKNTIRLADFETRIKSLEEKNLNSRLYNIRRFRKNERIKKFNVRK